MASAQLNQEVIDLLKAVKFQDAAISDITKWAPLVDMLNEFLANYPNSLKMRAIRTGDRAAFFENKDDPSKSYITIPPIGNSLYEQHEAVISLVHEVTHALSLSQIPLDDSSAHSATDRNMLAEGVAYYYTVIALSNIYPWQYFHYGDVEFRKDNETYAPKGHLFKQIHKIALGVDECADAACPCRNHKGVLNDDDPNKQEKFARIAELVRDLHTGGADTESAEVDLTYDERNKWI